MAEKTEGKAPEKGTILVKNNHHALVGYQLHEGPLNPGGRVEFPEGDAEPRKVTAAQAEQLCGRSYVRRFDTGKAPERRPRFVRVTEPARA
jgi:hypothetical protein